MSQQYYLHRDGKGRFLLQNAETGAIEGLVFPGMPGESAHAFSYDYGPVWYPQQLINWADFPELADMPFFTIESCGLYYLDTHFKQPEPQTIWPLLGSLARLSGYSLEPEPQGTLPKKEQNLIWKYQVPNPQGSWVIPILDLWVNEQGCWFCTREGQVTVLNHQGDPIQQHSLPKLTRCLAGWDEVPYVSCDDGNLYDLTSKLPQPIYAVRPANDYRYSYQIFALEQTPDMVLIGDLYGNLSRLNSDLELQWQQHQPENWLGWFLQSDGDRLYHGHYRGVTVYDLKTGQEKWMQRLAAPVLCGCLTQDGVVVGCSDRGLYHLGKTTDPKTGKVDLTSFYLCGGMPYTITLSADQQFFLVGDYTGKIEKIDRQGHLQTSLQLRNGAITGLQPWGDRLYVATSQGVLIALAFPFHKPGN